MPAEWMPLADLVPWPKNPRRNKAAIEKVAESIRRFGFATPIVARRANRMVIAGHTRREAALLLHLERVPVRLLDLSEADAELLALADNKLGEIAEWDDTALGRVLADLKGTGLDLAPSGFGTAEIDRLLADLAANDLANLAEDPVPEPPSRPDSEAGQVYELGPHRLLCGDSTRPEAVAQALGGQLADLLWTDPPYGVSYQSNYAVDQATGKHSRSRFARIENDDLTPEQLLPFLTAAFANAAAGMRPGAAYYVCHANQRPGIYAAFEAALLAAGFHISAVIAWVKQCGTMGWQDYRSGYEPILYGWKLGGEHRKVVDRTETNVWEIARDGVMDYEHPTQKPVELVARAIRNSTAADELVLDPFAGSGATLIAAARWRRRAVLVEKDPGYCDVIRQRWARFAAKAGLRG